MSHQILLLPAITIVMFCMGGRQASLVVPTVSRPVSLASSLQEQSENAKREAKAKAQACKIIQQKF